MIEIGDRVMVVAPSTRFHEFIGVVTTTDASRDCVTVVCHISENDSTPIVLKVNRRRVIPRPRKQNK